MSFLDELKRRNVLRVAAAYLVAAWLIVQVANEVLPPFGFDESVSRIIIIVLAIGFIPAVVVAWVFELTPDGLVRDRGQAQPADSASVKRFDRIVMLALAAAVVFFAVHAFILDPAADREAIDAARSEGQAAALRQSFGDKSIAVLPFVNMSSDPEQEYFGDGIAEELLHLLEKVPGLLVTSRTSSFKFKNTDLSVKEIADELGVVHVLEGSVRKSGNTLRITAQLIDSRLDSHLWSGTFDRELVDIFDIQDEVAARVVDELKIEMNVGMPTIERHDPEAYALYLRARAHLNLEDPALLDDAQQLIIRALEIEPDFIEVQALQTHLMFNLARRAWSAGDYEAGDTWMERRQAVVDDLRVRAPENKSVQTTLAWQYMMFENDAASAAAQIEQGLDDHSNDTGLLHAAFALASDLGQFDLAIAIGEYVVERDPLDYWAHSNLGDAYSRAGRHNEAVERYRTAASLSPNTDAAHWKLGAELLFAGRPEEALASMQREAGDIYRLHGLALAYDALGDVEKSGENLQALYAIPGETERWPYGFARAHAWLGDADKAFRFLDVMAEDGLVSIAEVMTNPYFQPIHDDPRWQPLVDRINAATPDIDFNPRLPPEVRARLQR